MTQSAISNSLVSRSEPETDLAAAQRIIMTPSACDVMWGRQGVLRNLDGRQSPSDVDGCVPTAHLLSNGSDLVELERPLRGRPIDADIDDFAQRSVEDLDEPG